MNVQLFVPCFIDQPLSRDYFAGIKEDLLGEHIGSADYLITSWLDNDDALGREFVASVQNLFAGQSGEFINFLHGYVFDSVHHKLYRRRFRANPFISLIEARKDFKTVWSASHLKAAESGTVRQVKTKPMWLQVVHGQNVRNRIGKKIRVPLSSLAENFTLNYDFTAHQEQTGWLILESSVTRLRRIARKLIKHLS